MKFSQFGGENEMGKSSELFTRAEIRHFPRLFHDSEVFICHSASRLKSFANAFVCILLFSELYLSQTQSQN